MTPLDVLAAGSPGRDPAGIALVSTEGSLRWSELEALVDSRAAALSADGLERGQVLPMVVSANREGVVHILAAWRAGAVPAPLNPRLTEPERALARAALRAAPPDAQAVLWTSGTAGRPRGVVLGGTGLLAHVEAVAQRLALDGSEVWLASLSPAHVGGLALISRAVLTGATLVASGPPDGDALVRLFRRASPPLTHVSLVPTQLARLLGDWGADPPPPELRCILIGGAHAPRDLVDGATRAGWPIALTYGMTEMWSQVATAPPEMTRLHPDAVGKPLIGVEMRIDSEHEILVRGPTLALGFVQAESMECTSLADPEGWYRTGDLGALDSDGLLRITGRRSDRIISGGVNVDPTEVEEVLRQHPAVTDVAVVGVPSREWGETVGAVVVPVWGEFDLSEVEAFLRARLGGAKRPRVWKIEAKLPLNANGKVDRAAVRSFFPAS